MDGVKYKISPGLAVFILSNVEHGVVAGPDGLTFVFGFGEDAFSAIDYQFSA